MDVHVVREVGSEILSSSSVTDWRYKQRCHMRRVLECMQYDVCTARLHVLFG